MASTMDEPLAKKEESAGTNDAGNSSTTTPSSPITSAPTKRSKRACGRKGSIMFTPSGSVGLGANDALKPTNISMPTDVTHEPPGNGDISRFTLDANSAKDEVETDEIDYKTYNGVASSLVAETKLNVKEYQPIVSTARKMRSSKGRKGSIMFTPTGAVGIGTSHLAKTELTGEGEKQLDSKMPTDIQLKQMKPTEIEPVETSSTKVVGNGCVSRNSKGRKGSIMFTPKGVSGLGSGTYTDANMNNEGETQLQDNLPTNIPLQQADTSCGDITNKSEAPSTANLSIQNKLKGRKGSIMFTSKGVVGLGAGQLSNSSSNTGTNDNVEENQNQDTDRKHELPKTYYTLPPHMPSTLKPPVTYFTQPPPSAYEDPAPQSISKFKEDPGKEEGQKLLSGESFVARLLKAELEGNRKVAVELERRGSCVMRSGGIGGLGIEGFEDSSDDEYKSKRRPGALPGSEDYRPLVGGFAAAAYEAAKALHFRDKQRSLNTIKDTENKNDNVRIRRDLPPPSI